MKNNFKILVCVVLVMITNHIYSQIYFEDLATNLGIVNSGGTGNFLGGVSFFDYDNDGWDDITLANKANDPVRFFKNNSGTFVEETFNITITGQSKQAVWVDYDNDGDNDLFVTQLYGINKLYQNDGNFVFTDVTVAAGFPNTAYKTYGVSFGDYDNDGHLDAFLCNKDDDGIIPNYLYHNNGDGTFTNVSTESGISHYGHLSFCSAFFDYDKDGFQDIYISNDRFDNPNIMYHNNGDGTFTDASSITGTALVANAMSTTIDDFDYDGWLDIYVTNTAEGNYLLKNNADGTFTNVAATTGTSLNSISWGANFFDADNDTDFDMYVSCMVSNPFIGLATTAFYERTSANMFVIPTTAGFDDDEYGSFSNAIGDIDNDGYTDFIVANLAPDNHSLWKNSGGTNNWLKVKLEGVQSNRAGIGSWIEISVDGSIQYRYTLCGEAFLGQNSATEIFGLGTATNVDYVQVTWLSGVVDTFTDVTPNQVLNIVEGSSLSISEHSINQIKLFPNPTNNLVYINGLNNNCDVYIYDVSGRNVGTQNVSVENNAIDLTQFSKGIYTLTIKNNSETVTKKVIVQ